VTDTAVMQQVEQGKLDLDADVNRYLDFKLPEAFGKACDVRNLMTHTAGFEELLHGLMHSDPESYKNLETYVHETTPVRMFPPGEVPSYCNYCLALAAYIVERSSGEKFNDYLDKRVFSAPRHAAFDVRQPLPEQLAPDMSKATRWPRVRHATSNMLGRRRPEACPRPVRTCALT
jgi:CubicO group peptidase (beta-lactamase class C family)